MASRSSAYLVTGHGLGAAPPQQRAADGATSACDQPADRRQIRLRARVPRRGDLQQHDHQPGVA